MYLEDSARDLPVAEAREIEVEPYKENGCACLNRQFFEELPLQRRERTFPGIDRTPEEAPMAGVEDARLLVAQLHNVAAVVEDKKGGDSVGGDERGGRGQEVVGLHVSSCACAGEQTQW